MPIPNIGGSNNIPLPQIDPTTTPEKNSHTPLFTPVVNKLLNNLENEENIPESTTAANDNNPMLLKNLFNYPTASNISGSTKLQDFWLSWKAGLHAEIVVHNTLHMQQTLIGDEDDTKIGETT
ncbi:hypothetical protein PAXRUDRAFT_27745 [Paxillus rubicundulus Ve08.2h10]|uniref:Uncharacterized protein n=1 Tax=Paxillus rubicundulus Ve08.2h10 TaxID=930991 RepID=A0A0D0D1F9_9AGAM|nr:hypothetical protein PAXRUDRAFT_27745 [Paxillus rubicundulus Ve08.2h10]